MSSFSGPTEQLDDALDADRFDLLCPVRSTALNGGAELQNQADSLIERACHDIPRAATLKLAEGAGRCRRDVSGNGGETCESRAAASRRHKVDHQASLARSHIVILPCSQATRPTRPSRPNRTSLPEAPHASM